MWETSCRENGYFLAPGNAVHAINGRDACLDHLLRINAALRVDGLAWKSTGEKKHLVHWHRHTFEKLFLLTAKTEQEQNGKALLSWRPNIVPSISVLFVISLLSSPAGPFSIYLCWHFMLAVPNWLLSLFQNHGFKGLLHLPKASAISEVYSLHDYP